jgi:hypothetical protein
VTLCGFDGYALAASAKASPLEIEAAWRAVAQLADKDFSQGWPAGTVSLCRESQFYAGGGLGGTQLQGDEAAACREAIAQSLRDPNLVVDLHVLGRAKFRQALSEALLPALERPSAGQSPEEASAAADQVLQAAFLRWSAIADELGVDELRDSYRMSLGLSPKPQSLE